MTDEEFVITMRQNGYSYVHKLQNGEWLGVAQFIYTCGLCVGLTEYSYRGRYCYANVRDALFDASTWDGVGDPPGPWIKYKGEDGERMNPTPS